MDVQREGYIHRSVKLAVSVKVHVLELMRYVG